MDVISISSDSYSDNSDVEIVGVYSNILVRDDPRPLSAVRVDVNALNVNVPAHYIDIVDSRWTLPELRIGKRLNSTSFTVVDLTEANTTNVTENETEKSKQDACPLTKDWTNPSVQPRLLNGISEESESIRVCQTTMASNGPPVESSLDESLPDEAESLARLEQENCDFTSLHKTGEGVQQQQNPATSSDQESSFESLIKQDKPHHSFQGEGVCAIPEELDLTQEDCGQINFSEKQFPHSPAAGLQPTEHFDMDSFSYTSHKSEHSLPDKSSELQLKVFTEGEASNSPDVLPDCRQSEFSLSFYKAEDQSNGSWPGALGGSLKNESPSFIWQEWDERDQVNAESRCNMDFRVASGVDRHFVCPVALKKIMSGSTQTLISEADERFGMPELLCRQSLNLIYSTIDEQYTEGTLQLLSDLLQPGYYPPKDITYHLLHDILLNPQCPYHLCLQAYNLLMRTQRHHMVDRTSVPWNWDLLTLVVDQQEQTQDHTKRLRCGIVCMLFEYVLQTLEDDIQAKSSASAVHHSIAKATLSYDGQLCRVRDIINWLFSAIKKSTDHEKSKTERDEQIRMVSILQRMLLLTLKVDRSPALNSVRLSQELFLGLIGKMHLRAHRMLLLESLQSKLVRCKLLVLLLDYACPTKSCQPMSLSLLLHFMKYCTLASDPADGSERWQKWEELVHLLWMLLLSYNKAMKGCLYGSVTERSKTGTLVYKPDDMVTKPAVCEAVEAFLSRTQADLGQALPLHVEESLTYLQEHLLDVCQC